MPVFRVKAIAADEPHGNNRASDRHQELPRYSHLATLFSRLLTRSDEKEFGQDVNITL
jgi:hypothetical protein